MGFGLGTFVSFVGAVLTIAGYPLGPAIMISGGIIGSAEAKQAMREAQRAAEEAMRGLRTTTKTTERPLPVIYGRNRVSGNVVWMSTDGRHANDYDPPRNKLFTLFGLSEGPIDAIEEMYFNDDKVWDVNVGHVKGSHYNRFHFEYRLGTNSQAPFTHLADYHKLYEVASETFPLMAMAMVELFYDEDAYPTGIPNVTWTIRGKQVPDWTDVNSPGILKWSQSGVLQAADLLTNKIYGMGINTANLDISSIKSAHAYVTENVAPTSRGVYETIDQSNQAPKYYKDSFPVPTSDYSDYDGYPTADSTYELSLGQYPVQPGSLTMYSSGGSLYYDAPRSGLISEFGRLLGYTGSQVGSVDYFGGKVLLNRPLTYKSGGVWYRSYDFTATWYVGNDYSFLTKYRNITSLTITCSPEVIVTTGTLTSSGETALYSAPWASGGAVGSANLMTGQIQWKFGYQARWYENDVPIDVSYRVNTRARFETNYPLFESKKIVDAISELQNNYRGFLVYSQGKYSLKIDKPESGGVTDAALLDAASASNVNPMTKSVSAGTNRLLVVAVTQEYSTTMPAVSATYGGQALTWLRGEEVGTGTLLKIDILYLKEAGIAAASGSSLSISGLTSADFTIHARTYENVNQTTPIRQSSATESDTATPNPLTLTLSVEAGSIAVGMAGCGNTDTCTWNADLTERTEQAGTGSHTGSYADKAYAAADSGVTVAATWVTQNRAIVIGLEVSGDPMEGGSQFSFNDDNIVAGTFQFRQPSTSEIPTKVVVKYLDSVNNYTPAEASFDARSVDPGYEVQHVLNLPGVHNRDEANAIAYTYANLANLLNTVSFRTNYTAQSLEAGMVVDITHPSAAWEAKLFRILSIQFTDNETYGITAIEHDPSAYVDDWIEGPIRSRDPSFFPKQSFWPPNVTSAQVQELARTLSDGTTMPYIRYDIYQCTTLQIPVAGFNIYTANLSRGQFPKLQYSGVQTFGYIGPMEYGNYSVSIKGVSKFGKESPQAWVSSVDVDGVSEFDWQRWRLQKQSTDTQVINNAYLSEMLAIDDEKYIVNYNINSRRLDVHRLYGSQVYLSGALTNVSTRIINLSTCTASGNNVGVFWSDIGSSGYIYGAVFHGSSLTLVRGQTLVSTAIVASFTVFTNAAKEISMIGHYSPTLYQYATISCNLVTSTPQSLCNPSLFIFDTSHPAKMSSFLTTSRGVFVLGGTLINVNSPGFSKSVAYAWTFTMSSFDDFYTTGSMFYANTGFIGNGINFMANGYYDDKCIMVTDQARAVDGGIKYGKFIFSFDVRTNYGQGFRINDYISDLHGGGYVYGFYMRRPIVTKDELLTFYPKALAVSARSTTSDMDIYRYYRIEDPSPSEFQTWV